MFLYKKDVENITRFFQWKVSLWNFYIRKKYYCDKFHSIKISEVFLEEKVFITKYFIRKVSLLKTEIFRYKKYWKEKLNVNHYYDIIITEDIFLKEKYVNMNISYVSFNQLLVNVSILKLSRKVKLLKTKKVKLLKTKKIIRKVSLLEKFNFKH